MSESTTGLAEAETVAARAWDRPPDSATYLLWSWLSGAMALLLLARAATELYKEVTTWCTQQESR